MNHVRERAYAKINYQLYVGARRDDGFHEIVTLMQTISLFDELTVTVRAGEGITLAVTGNDCVPTDSRNLVWRAIELYMTQIGARGHVSVLLEKRIPMAGGLAGGSADAAAVLRALNRIYDHRLKTEELLELAARLGSDIPFCVIGGLALCTGRGEILTPLAPLSGKRHFVIINRGEGVSTAEAYAMLDSREHLAGRPADERACIACLENDLESVGGTMYNSFEPFVLPLCPLAKEARQLLTDNGAVAAMMSGSGSTVYGIYADREAAIHACETLPFSAIYVTDIFDISEVSDE